MENDRNLFNTTYSIPAPAPTGPRWTSSAAKRLVDIAAAALGLLLLSPVPSPRPARRSRPETGGGQSSGQDSVSCPY